MYIIQKHICAITFLSATPSIVTGYVHQYNSFDSQPDVLKSLYSPLQPSNSLEGPRYLMGFMLLNLQKLFTSYLVPTSRNKLVDIKWFINVWLFQESLQNEELCRHSFLFHIFSTFFGPQSTLPFSSLLSMEALICILKGKKITQGIIFSVYKGTTKLLF